MQQEIKLFRPSNGTQGDGFISGWCMKCARDKPLSEGKDYDECTDNEICKIVLMTQAYNIEDEEYPREWQYNEDGEPICTAFIQAGYPIPLKDDLTMDMFE